jgi:hypothetical protein
MQLKSEIWNCMQLKSDYNLLTILSRVRLIAVFFHIYIFVTHKNIDDTEIGNHSLLHSYCFLCYLTILLSHYQDYVFLVK